MACYNIRELPSHAEYLPYSALTPGSYENQLLQDYAWAAL